MKYFGENRLPCWRTIYANIYIFKDNEQSGPVEEAQVVEWLKTGRLSPDDRGIRHGESEWRPLSVLFPEAQVFTVPSIPSSVAGSQRGFRRPLGILGMVAGLLLILGVLATIPLGLFGGASDRSFACVSAEKAKGAAEIAFEEFKDAKGKPYESSKAEELKTKTNIMESWGRTCAEQKRSSGWGPVIRIAAAVFGLMLAGIGLLLMRSR